MQRETVYKSSIHPHLHILIRVVGGLEPITAVIVQEVVNTLDRSPISCLSNYQEGFWCVFWADKKGQEDLIVERGSTGKYLKEKVNKEKLGS